MPDHLVKSMFVLLLAAALSATAAGAGDDLSVEQRISLYEAPALGSPASVRDLAVKVGHLRLTMREGLAARVRAGDEPVGVFFAGSGTIEYDSVNREELAVLEYNAKHSTDLTFEKTESGARVRGEIDRMLLLGSRELFPDVDDGAEEAPVDPDGVLGDAFRKHGKLFGNDRFHPTVHFLLKHALDAPGEKTLRAELSGPAGNLCYLYDPVDRRSEMLYGLRRIRGSLPAGARWPVTVSEQPLGRDLREFKQPLFLLTDVDYTLVADAKENASLSVVETIVPLGKDQRVFRFDLYNEFFDNNGKPREWRLTAAQDAHGRALRFRHERDELLVVLSEAAPAGKPVRLHFKLEGRILVQPNNDAYWMLGVEPWFPLPDLGGQMYTVHSVLKVPKPFVPIAPGTTLSRHEEGDLNVVENRIDRPVQFVVAMAGKYAFEEETRDGILVRVASYAGPKKSAAQKLSNLAHKTIDYYQKFLGPFPFDEYNVIEINSLGWGQAPPATMFITKEAFTPWFNRVWSQGINHRFAHEIAHQYWGHVVKMGSGMEQWITEAFSEYCASFVVRQVRGEKGFRDLVADWQDNARVAGDKSSIAYAHRIFASDWGDYVDRKSLIYDKGALFLAALHEEVGDAAFASFLRSTQAGFAWKFASTTYMPMILERITGEDHTELFEKYFWDTGMPPAPKALRAGSG